MNKMDRRNFVKSAAVLGSISATGLPVIAPSRDKNLSLKIEKAEAVFEREPLIHSYGFKGGYITTLWQIVTQLSQGSHKKVGLGIQSPLWSDSTLTGQWGESGSNALMYAMTAKATQLIQQQSFESPIDMLDQILEEVYDYGKSISQKKDLRMTYALNALVSVDNAAWLLYAAQNKLSSFDEMLPKDYRKALSYQHKKVASIPSISFSTSDQEIANTVTDGFFFLKVKIGSPGNQEEMLRRDMERMTLIHKTIGQFSTPNTADGKIRYYFDANGRYQSKDDMMKLLDHCRKIGALDQISILEEPFNENLDIDVSDMGLRVAADESAHTDRDALRRIEMGYTAIALKPIAKTLSMTLKIAKLAYERNIPCLCADLTVNPVLVDWNKSVAARLLPLPGLDTGLLETNGHQNYARWEELRGYHPQGHAPWTEVKDGVFNLSSEFYKQSGGIFDDSKHYLGLFK
ncbi:mandelate racemase/muconate lactonizing enzyme family protein [Membranihabitans marinus]|uniref:mandelate racemase/muconate lactonizing enzyme family protein n=1 Tax=Membranihabitans marinus TaxID=1227546 RepID=UPI001F2921AD|nr:mandelate racemase/muconate lactonizing enzyme family protein [Membranihabitans marinus]